MRSVGFVLVAGIVVPGLPSLLMGRTGIGLVLLLVVPIAFALFGPIWGMFLFAGTPYTEHGFYPFVLTAIATPVISVLHGLLVRRQLLRRRATLP